MMTGFRWWLCALCAGLACTGAGKVAAAEYYDDYPLHAASPALDLGGQPLGYPSGMLSAVMARDLILRAALEKAGTPLASHAFRRGADMLGLLGDQRLEAGLLGDMPTIISAARGDVVIVGLVKRAATALVARGDWQLGALAGKRIGYVEASSAHHTLLQGLAAAGLNEQQVTLVKLRIDEMPGALERGEIDAFAGWEPAPAVALAASERNHIVFRGISTDYFVLNTAFVRNSPEAARLLVAGYLRAINWMRLSQRNQEQAARWTLADAAALNSASAEVSVSHMASIARRDLLDVPGAPAVVHRASLAPLQAEYEFLARLGKLSAGATPQNLAAAFAYDGLSRVVAGARLYRINEFDYAR